MFPAPEIAEVSAVSVGFSFKRYVAVGPIPVAELYKPHKPFQNIKDIERYPEQFALLRGMYPFMVHYSCVYPTDVARQYDTEKIHAVSFRHPSASDYALLTFRVSVHRSKLLKDFYIYKLFILNIRA